MANGYDCSLCGGPMRVLYTRGYGTHVVRRRICLDDDCGLRTTTVEREPGRAAVTDLDAVIAHLEKLRADELNRSSRDRAA